MKLERAFDILYRQLESHPRADCLSARKGKQWVKLSTPEVVETINRVSHGFLRLGIGRGDRVAIMADNSIEWVLVDLALQQIGAISVPIYPTVTVEDASYILMHADVKMAFVGNASQHSKVHEALGRMSSPIYSFTDIDGVRSWREIELLGDGGDDVMLAALRDSIRADEVFTIIYTSGTTGRSKGVMLSHRNLVSTVVAIAEHTKLPVGTLRALSFLPLSHIFERAGVYYYMSSCTGVYFAGVEQLSSAMQEVRPHTFSAVPRVLEKLHDKLAGKATELTGSKQKLYKWALELAENYDPNAKLGLWQKAQLAFADKMIFSKWRAAMGGELKWVNVGSAALQPRLARLLWAAGIMVAEGYGMTECSPVISADLFDPARVRIGSVGVPMPHCEVKIAEDGEILVRGPNVMVGYYKEPEQTAETIIDGWLHTGDIGKLEDGVLTITDRKKEMFKTSNGKYIAPQVIENKLKESAFIDQVMVVGDGQKYAAALIVPLFEKIKEWCSQQGIAYTSDAEMARNPKVQALIEREVKRFNRYFGSWEHVKKVALVDRAWCVDAGELAPTLKLRRKVIAQRCSALIERLFQHHPA
ncbi:AMP-dependent synthetase/ligase [Crenobacter intestini]|uniref:Long-chain fatty acid--CoA ligase n=1 Tax=Crenobacter intestini TaxID=2563443 RepID=A0A4T0UK32_9NEIS|nr:long-chain fatty acid--CoA ligase [Crenobacter intestini]TIC78970.1 long-chain fatty acid--CoA ligase [Crenobacter intestini]